MTRILVVEDEGIVARDLQRTLQALGYDVPEPCSTGEAAILAAERVHPDVVMMDIHLAGDMSGTEAAKTLVSRHDCAVIFLTAYADQATVDAAGASLPYGYLVKPYEETSLRAALATAVTRLEADRAREDRHRRVLDGVDEGIILADAAGMLTYANRLARKFFPSVHSVADLLGPDWPNLGESGQIERAGQLYYFRLQETDGHWALVVLPDDQGAAENADRAMIALVKRARDLI